MRTMHRRAGPGLAAILALALAGCAHEGQATGAESGAPAGEDAMPAAPETPATEDPAYGAQNLLDPTGALMNETAPDVYRARFETTAGTFVIEVTRAWSPNGADRFYNLVRNGFFDGSYFFRAVANFMVQFGLPADPAVGTAWTNATIPDDAPTGHSNTRGMVTFAKTRLPNSRSTQLFINYGDNSGLDAQGFTPIGQVIDDGMTAVDAIHTGYGDAPPNGVGPDQGRIRQYGSAFLEENFPELTRIERAVIASD